MLSKLKTYLVYALVGLVVGLSLYVSYLRHKASEGDRVLAQQIQERAASLGGIQVELDNERILTKNLSEANRKFLNELQKIDRRVQPVVSARAVATIEDTVVLGPDESRFTLSADGKTIFRRQEFSLDVLLLRNSDNNVSVGRVSLMELDPDSHIPLKSEFHLESRIQIVDSATNSRVSVLHPRVIGGIEAHGYPLIGVELLNGERFGGPVLGHLNVSLVGVYNPKDKTVLGGVGVGYRLFNSNVSVGAAWFYPSRKFGAMVSVQLSR